MKAIAYLFLLIVAVAAFAVPVQAWEFSMKWEYELRYRYISRMGPNDLFGNADDAQKRDWVGEGLAWPVVTSIGLAGPSHRYVQIEGLSSKGSDGAYAEHRLWVYPRVAANKAITLYAILAASGNLNAMYNPLSPPQHDLSTPEVRQIDNYIPASENWATNPHHSGWIMLDSRDVVRGVAMAAPMFHALWAKIKLPWGLLVFGRRPAGFGMGWVAHTEDNYSTSLTLIAPYGPLTFAFSQYLHDSGKDTDPNDYANRFADFRNLIPHFYTYPYTIASSVDQNEAIDWNQAYAIVYRSANLDLGAMARVIRWSNIHTRSLSMPPPPPNSWELCAMMPS
jgi:hypothetical protein